MRTRILIHTLPLLCSGALLVACGSPYLRHEAPQAAVAAADEHYLRGRNLHLARRYEDAIAAYQQALQADATHVNATSRKRSRSGASSRAAPRWLRAPVPPSCSGTSAMPIS